ncbi:MAG: glycerate kinase, partial [Caulobacterales bacterium 68-7]
YGTNDTRRIVVREARHPVPDEASEAAAREILASVQGLGPDDLVLALISGGGSSVLSLPAPGLTLADKQATNRALLASGLDIRTMNAVRRRLSGIKGGKLAAAAAPARIVTLTISDIPGDDPAAIASGPTLADSYAAMDLSDAIARLEGRVPPAVIERLRRAEPPPVVARAEVRMIATPGMALQAAAAVARDAGLEIEILGDDLEGESANVGAEQAALALAGRDRPTVILSGGETTVTIGGGKAGRGGRNTEFLLALGRALDGAPGVWGLAGDTDGEDGASGGGAGALLAPDTLHRARALGLDVAVSLANHDSGGFFDAIGDLVVTGPTRTNVNDFRAILVTPQA